MQNEKVKRKKKQNKTKKRKNEKTKEEHETVTLKKIVVYESSRVCVRETNNI